LVDKGVWEIWPFRYFGPEELVEDALSIDTLSVSALRDALRKEMTEIGTIADYAPSNIDLCGER
jgi:hypothetical protein